MNLKALKFEARVKIGNALGMLLPETVLARLSGLGEAPQIGEGATLANIQYAIRLSERGEPYFLWTLFRDMTRNDSHLQAEIGKRIMSFMGQAETIEPFDKNNPDDVVAAEVIQDMIDNCDNWNKGSVHLALGHIWPITGAEKIYEPVNGEDRHKWKHPVNYRLKKLHPIPYALYTYKIAYYNLNSVGSDPNGGGIVPSGNMTQSGVMPIQQTAAYQPLMRNFIGEQNPALLWNPEDWHADLRFYNTYENGLIDWTMENCYKPDPVRHVLHSSDVATAGLRENYQGVMQGLLPWWLFTQSGRDWFARFMERYASPFAVAYANTANKNIFDLLTKAFNQATKTNALIVPPQAKIELKEVMVSGAADGYAKFIEVCNTEKTKAILGQTLSTSSKGSGMMGGSGVADLHGEVKEEWALFDKRTYCEMQRKQIFEPFLKINGYKGRCRAVRGGISAQQLALTAKSLQQLAQCGIFVDESDEQKLTNMAGLKMRIVDPLKLAEAGGRQGQNPKSHAD